MESKTKHRILGILVIIGVIIILLPFLQAGKDNTSETTIVQAPPFPEQTIQAENTQPLSAEFVQPHDTIATNPAIYQTQEINPITPGTNTNDLNAMNNPSVVAAQPQQEQEIMREVTANNTVTAENTNERNISPDSNASIPEEPKADQPQAFSQANEKVGTIKTLKQLSKSSLNADDENGLVNLKTQAYVIQIGSFKDKTNAIRLVNTLRSKGYRAFIQQVSTALGDSTRVFIGPEVKRSVARAIASRLERDMHIQGIVISYKPLTL